MFEDPDRSKVKELLSMCQLYLFGARAIKKWKQLPSKPLNLPSTKVALHIPEIEALSKAATDNMEVLKLSLHACLSLAPILATY